MTESSPTPNATADPATTPRPAVTEASPADELVDDLLPAELDWRYLARAYPVPVLAAATVGGFLVGRRHGRELLLWLGDFVTEEVTRNVKNLVGETASRRSSSDEPST